MVFPLLPTLCRIKFMLMAAALSGLMVAAPVFAGAEAEEAQPSLPAEYGKIIYRKEGNRDNHLYIILQSHRNAGTGENGNNTVEVQTEVYRIGEWLVRHEKVGLLLPEGYFHRRNQPQPIHRVSYSSDSPDVRGRFLDDAALKAVLNDTSQFTNADRLLMENYGLRLQQVEDKELYHSILDILFRRDRRGFDEQDIRILSYMQEKRSAFMLQSVPGAIDRELQQGGIMQRKAIFTIGLAHLNEMIRFLREGKIEIYSPLIRSIVDKGSLKLLEADYGVTVILPRSLLNDSQAVRIANLD